MEGLAPIEAWTVTAIIVKAAGYGAALLAMGGPLFLVAFPDSDDDMRRLARKIAVIAGLIGLAVLALHFGIRAARISGMGLSGAIDPMMLGFVWESPLGTASIWRSVGEVLVVTILLGGAIGCWGGLAGALLMGVGLVFAWLMSGSVSALLTTAYGWALLVKFGAVLGVMTLAARNKWRLVPALASGAPHAAIHLRHSIYFESLAVVLILIAMAILTLLTTPPVNL